MCTLQDSGIENNCMLVSVHIVDDINMYECNMCRFEAFYSPFLGMIYCLEVCPYRLVFVSVRCLTIIEGLQWLYAVDVRKIAYDK